VSVEQEDEVKVKHAWQLWARAREGAKLQVNDTTQTHLRNATHKVLWNIYILGK